MISILKKLRPMRVVLYLMAISSLILKAEIGTPVSYEGWQMIETVFLPVMAPLLIMVTLLDSIIASIWLTQTTGDEKNRYKLILTCNLSMVILMLSIWIPYFLPYSAAIMSNLVSMIQATILIQSLPFLGHY